MNDPSNATAFINLNANQVPHSHPSMMVGWAVWLAVRRMQRVIFGNADFFILVSLVV
jgi:hypothetical protein